MIMIVKIFCLNNDEHSFHDNIGTVSNNIESDLNAGFVEPADKSTDPISENEDTRSNIRIHCHKRKINSIDAKLDGSNYYPFILPVGEQTYSVT